MTEESRLEDLLARFESLRAQGQEVPNEELCRDCPELLERFRAFRKAAAWGQRLQDSQTSPPSGVDSKEDTTPFTDPVPLTGAWNFLRPAEQPGELGRLGGFRVLRLLGQGGMGYVFVAEDLTLGRQLALKVMRPEIAAEAKACDRFRAEARAAAKLEHDHIVPILQVGEDQGVLFIAMPLLKGQSLDARLHEPEPLTGADIVRLGRHTAEGLAAAHAAGLIHRDIKPGNLFLEKHADGPRLKILDFGLARVLEGDALANYTPAGTAGYMAPEQLEGQAIGPRADLFSLGCVLYRLVTGQHPFPGKSIAVVLKATLFQDPPPTANLRPELPPALHELLRRLLAKKPANRPATAALVAEELRRIECALYSPSPSGAFSVKQNSGSFSRLSANPTRQVPSALGRRPRWLYWLAAGVALALACVALWWRMR